ncbi:MULTISPECIES: SHOCT domain-containing protein [Clostridium]|uniref:SHOCT domain-containing protein n=1 Tax=Clostridium paridis TaxID=2803863 RepID=A0A937K5T9_9CLOT|nr:MULTISPECIES: SHOCT domain-containing protein [Clostridium]MBL4933434.1 SHOCT domain-containing protein [Clostridium paridis]
MGRYDGRIIMGGFHMGWIFMIICLILIALAIYFVIRVLNKNNFIKDTEESSLNILKERLAKGEISEEEYLRKAELIRKK